MLITAPLQLIITIILFFELRENPFFIQERGITLSKGRLRMLKFRTIKNNTVLENRIDKEFLIPFDENHITKFANFLRKKGLDELPQLYHVVVGKMSLVGPRPLMIKDIVFMKENFPLDYEKRNILKNKPGITGLWQLQGNKSSGTKNLIELDTLYQEKQSFIFDLYLLYQTVLYVITPNR